MDTKLRRCPLCNSSMNLEVHNSPIPPNRKCWGFAKCTGCGKSSRVLEGNSVEELHKDWNDNAWEVLMRNELEKLKIELDHYSYLLDQNRKWFRYDAVEGRNTPIGLNHVSLKYRVYDRVSNRYLSDEETQRACEIGCNAESPYILEKCLGLQDKNGDLIYSGDVVCVYNTHWKEFFDVFYNVSKCAFELVRHETDIAWETWYTVFTKGKSDRVEIIGNIHEQIDCGIIKSTKPEV